MTFSSLDGVFEGVNQPGARLLHPALELFEQGGFAVPRVRKGSGSFRSHSTNPAARKPRVSEARFESHTHLFGGFFTRQGLTGMLYNDSQVPLVPPYIEALQPYEAGRTIESVRRQFSLERIAKLASNENPLGSSPQGRRGHAASRSAR